MPRTVNSWSDFCNCRPGAHHEVLDPHTVADLGLQIVGTPAIEHDSVTLRVADVGASQRADDLELGCRTRGPAERTDGADHRVGCPPLTLAELGDEIRQETDELGP